MFLTLFLLNLFLISTTICRNLQHLNDVDITNTTTRVLGTDYTLQKEQKHLVRLDFEINFIKSPPLITHCSGSVISENWIFSSAHCFSDKTRIIYDINVEVKQRQIYQWIALGAVTKNNIILHPNYDCTPMNHKVDHDLALLKTSKPMRLSKYLVPIKLNRILMSHQHKFFSTAVATISGYGDNEFGTNAPTHGLVTIYACPSNVGSNVLCSKGPIRGAPGDSGGSLVLVNGKLAGVTSATCEDFYVSKQCQTIYVEVAAYLEWISNVTNIK